MDTKAGRTYYVKGSVGVGLVMAHPHLVLVANDVGAREITACNLVSGTAAAAPEGESRPVSPGGPMAAAVIDIAATDIVKSPAQAIPADLEVIDRRSRITLERTTIGHRTMSSVVLRPSETELIKTLMVTKPEESLPAGTGLTGMLAVRCDIDDFSITTPATALYWDVTKSVALTLQAGDRQKTLTGHAVKRTYVWPSNALLKTTTVEALKSIAAQSGPALRELLAAP